MNTHVEKGTQADAKAEAEKDLPVAATGTALAIVDIDEEDISGGLKNIKDDERRIPFVRILQTNSPELEDGNSKKVPGATPGQFINTATRQTFSKLICIPCARDHKFLEYTPRTIGGGFVGVHTPDLELVTMLRAKAGTKFGKLSNGVTRRDNQGNALDGTEVIESYEIYGIFIDPETEQFFRGIATFASTQISKYQTWVDRADAIRYRTPDGKVVPPPFWQHRWLLTTATEKNKKGTFKGYVIGLEAKKPDGSDDVPIKSLVKKSDPFFVMAKAFNKFVEEGKAEVDYKQEASVPQETTDEVEM